MKIEKPKMPELPKLGSLLPAVKMALPAIQKIKTKEQIAAENYNPLDDNLPHYTGNTEHDTALDDKRIGEEFAAIREGRAKQQAAIELANDTEYWFAVYFQTREQKEAFLQAMDWFEHGDKYLEGQFIAAKQGIKLPPRPAPYKVGRIDKKLADLT